MKTPSKIFGARPHRPRLNATIAGRITEMSGLLRRNKRCARNSWGRLSKSSLQLLTELTNTHRLSVAAGHLQLLDGRWYITHSGLLLVALRNRCKGMITTVENQLSDPVANRWVFKATVYKSCGSRGFVGYGDADPSNVSLMVQGAEMRIAETRAVNRALRKAYGIGLCSVEELGSLSGSHGPTKNQEQYGKPDSSSGSSNGQPRLRDRLCVLIRQHNLDPTLVKAYAADFCGTETLSGASRIWSNPSSPISLQLRNKTGALSSASLIPTLNRWR